MELDELDSVELVVSSVEPSVEPSPVIPVMSLPVSVWPSPVMDSVIVPSASDVPDPELVLSFSSTHPVLANPSARMNGSGAKLPRRAVQNGHTPGVLR